MSDAYQVITDRIISLLEEGTVPWHRPWGSPEDFPKNLVSGKEYRGINPFLLSSAGYESPYWLTFKQAKERGGSVRKGEKGMPCIYWNTIEIADTESGETKNRGFLKRYTVFNVTQCEDVPYPSVEKVEREFEPIESCEKLVARMSNPPKIEHDGNDAMYLRSRDIVRMPNAESFESPEHYYSTLFHELVHSTGHEKRLNRLPISNEALNFGYAKEELVAEMGAAFLCGRTGLDNKTIDNSAAYIDSWLGRLRHDSRLVVQAAGKAQKAADYIIGKQEKDLY